MVIKFHRSVKENIEEALWVFGENTLEDAPETADLTYEIPRTRDKGLQLQRCFRVQFSAGDTAEA
jgi:hypothetical protein